jgi:hypothetical protein
MASDRDHGTAVASVMAIHGEQSATSCDDRVQEVLDVEHGHRSETVQLKHVDFSGASARPSGSASAALSNDGCAQPGEGFQLRIVNVARSFKSKAPAPLLHYMGSSCSAGVIENMPHEQLVCSSHLPPAPLGPGLFDTSHYAEVMVLLFR